jgi:3-oxoacyl-(acyl-carrier-protein) synthase
MRSQDEVLMDERVVVTGIGLVTALAVGREATWKAIQRGTWHVQPIRNLRPLPDGLLWGAVVDLPRIPHGVAKTWTMARLATAEALRDARLQVTPHLAHRCGCVFNAHIGYLDWYYSPECMPKEHDSPSALPWYRQWLPNSTCVELARHFQLHGPRSVISTGCASSLIGIIVGARWIAEGYCDVVVAGGSESIDPLFAAGFRQMGVLSPVGENGPTCRPFDAQRDGFVLGEGAGVIILESLTHAVRRGAGIYAEYVSGHVLSEAQHVAGLDPESQTLKYVVQKTLEKGQTEPKDVHFISAHATATEANDLAEMKAYGEVFSCRPERMAVSGLKSMLGHLINASGAVESAITLLAMRDGFLPPTMHIRRVDAACPFDCLPWRGVERAVRHALKVSVAFGGHIAAVLWRRDRNAANVGLRTAAARAA